MSGARPELDEHVVRFADLAQHESPYHPFDMQLPRYERKRYSVVGRPAEQAGAPKGVHEVKDFSVVYIACEPGKGIGAHAHATPEVFIPLSGNWRLTLGEEELMLGPWDVLSVPPDVMHGAENVSEQQAWLLVINAGHAGAKIHWAPELLAEIKAQGLRAEASEEPGRR